MSQTHLASLSEHRSAPCKSPTAHSHTPQFRTAPQHRQSRFTYLLGHVLVALLVAREQLVPDDVLLAQHLILLLHFHVRLESLVQQVPLELLLAPAELIALCFDLLELAEQIKPLALHLESAVASDRLSEVVSGAAPKNLTIVE